ncbi:MAG TPA: DUF222 domain-containing protein [Trebonia sp.]|nr:DUF222 domain-containing protein [Trebonia sp.]
MGTGTSFDNPATALRAANAALDCLNLAANAGPEAATCGEVLLALGELQAKLTAAHAGWLRRFDAADAHDADGYGSSAAWLSARAGMPRKAARAAVSQMRKLSERPLLGQALASGEITDSLAFAIADWTCKLPQEMRAGTDRILLEAAAAGASVDDLATIARFAVERWRQQQPDPDEPDDGFSDRSVQIGVTFGGAALIRGNLTPECATELRAVLQALGKKTGPEDNRIEAQRFHDGLQQACTLLLRADLVPDRAGADTQAVVHIPLSQLREMPGAPELEDEWVRARLGEDGYLTGAGAQAAACDAQTVPVVTGTIHPPVIDKMIGLLRSAAEIRDGGLVPSPGAWDALRHAITRLAVDLVSGPSGVAAMLRRGLLDKPWNPPSLPLDIGYSHSIPGHIRRAVQLRDRHCAWPRCDRPAVYCDVHHLRHQADGGETSLANCILLCNFHHDICIHRRGWRLILHPDGTTEARSPDGRQVLRSHAPPDSSAAA